MDASILKPVYVPSPVRRLPHRLEGCKVQMEISVAKGLEELALLTCDGVLLEHFLQPFLVPLEHSLQLRVLPFRLLFE